MHTPTVAPRTHARRRARSHTHSNRHWIWLLFRRFYRTKLRPLLANWLLIWFSFHKKSALSDEQILGYLLKEQVREVHARERVVCERVGVWAGGRACVHVFCVRAGGQS